MLLKERTSKHMVEVTNLLELMNFHHIEVEGRIQEGEEQQDPANFDKHELVFLSGEALPRCWTDPHYRDNEIQR